MLKAALFTLGIVGFSVIFLCIKMILKPGSRFAGTHISDSKAMRARSIHCVQSMDRMDRKENPLRVKERQANNI